MHAAKLKDGRSVAVKIQYPGVAQGIESDISNLMGLLKVAKILPEGLFIDTVIKHLKVEMAQECDYEREAECCRKMRAVLEPYPQAIAFFVSAMPTILLDSRSFCRLKISKFFSDHKLRIDQKNCSQN